MVMNLRRSLPFTTSQLMKKIWSYSDLCEMVKSVDLATRRRAAAAGWRVCWLSWRRCFSVNVIIRQSGEILVKEDDMWGKLVVVCPA